MPDQPKVFISILNWNGLDDTLECLESIYKMDYRNYEVIVVDNASSDDSVSVIKEKYPQAILIESMDNMGFTGGNNIAMRYAMEHCADYVWLLNNDATVEKNALFSLTEYAENDPTIGLISPQINYYRRPELPQYAGSYVDWESVEIQYPEENADSINQVYQTGKDVCLWGTALLIRRALIEKIGYLDERYFAYWEDSEYSIRSLQSGYKNILYPGAKIYHKSVLPQEQNRAPHFYFYMLRNEYFLKNSILKGRRRFNFKKHYYSKVLSILSHFVKYQNGHEESIAAVSSGVWNGLRNRGGAMSKAEKAPQLFKMFLVLLASYPPYLWSYLLDGNFSLIYEKGLGKLGWRNK